MLALRHTSFLLGLVALLGSSCLGPKAQVVVAFRDPHLTRQSLHGKTIALAEVVTAPGTDYLPNEVQKELILKDLAARLSESRHQIKVIGPGASPQARAVSLKADARWLKSGALRLPLSLGERTRLQAAGTDYVMLIALQANNVAEQIGRYSQTTTDVETDKEGKEISRTDTTTYYTSALNCRAILANCYLFDLKSGVAVWMAGGSASRCSATTDSSTSGYPEAPLFKQAPGEAFVMELISAAVVKKLP